MLCTFHFLQSRWTYLWDAKNGVIKNNRAVIIGLIKEMVFAENVDKLDEAFENFVTNKTVSKYSHLVKYFEGFWSRKAEWAPGF